MPKSAIEYFNETQNYLNSDSYLNKDTQTQDEELKKFNKVFGELVKNETANMDNESVKKYMSQFNKEYNPSERKKWAKSPSKWTDQEYVAQVKDIKASPEWEELTDKERNDLNIEFGNEYRLRKLAKGESIEAVDYNANQDANQRVADYYNENAKAAVEYLGELAGQHWHLDDNQPKEVKDLTLGNAAKAALKSAARIPGSVASSGLGFLGGLTGLAGSATGSDTLKDLGAVMGTGANTIDAVNQGILPPEQKAIEGIKDIIPGMGDRTLGQKVLTGIDQLPEQLGTWIMPGVMAKTAKGAVEGAKAYRLAKNLQNIEKVSKNVKKSAELASKLPKLGKLSIGAKKSADLAQVLGLHNYDPEKAAKFAGTLGSMGLELSEMFKNATAKEGEVKDPLHMGLMAAGAGLLEDWVPSKLFRMDKLKPATRAMLRRDFGKGFWKSSKAFIGNLGKDTIRNIASEGGTELLQTYLEQAAANRNAGGSWFLPYDDAVKIKKLLNEKGLEGVIEEAKHNERLADIISATVLGGISGGLGNIGSNAGNYISYNTSPEGYLDRYRENREALINEIDNAKTDEERNQKQQQLDQLNTDLTNWKLSNPDNAAKGDFDTIYRSFEEMANPETSEEDLKDAFRTLSRLSDDSFLNYTSLLQEAGWENNPTFYNNLDKLIKYREDINFKSLTKDQQSYILKAREEAERQAKIAEEERIRAEEEARKQAEFKKQYGDLEKALLERAGYINLENQEKINQLLARVTDEGQKAELNRRLEELKKEEAEIYRRMGYAEDEAALQPNTQTEEQQNQPLYYNADGSPVYDTANVNVQQKTSDNTSKEEVEKNISKYLATKKKLEGFLKKVKDPEKVKKLKRSLEGVNKKLNELYSSLNNNQQVNSITDSIKTRQAEEKLAKKEQENESLRNTIAGLQSQGNLKDVKGKPLPNGRSGFVGNRARLKAGDIDTECEYAIVELADLQTLSDEENPRQRNDRQAYQNTVSERARNLDPDLLIDNSVGAQNGPIVVDQNLKVESGNGRTLSLIEAYKNRKGEGEYSGAQTDAGYGRADLYRNKLIAEAPKYGISSEQVMQMKEPVLVRIRVADSNINAKDFWAKANNSQQEAMSSTETAMVDGEKIKPLLKQFEAIGDIRAKSNLDFVKSFLEKICSPYELNSMFTADGKSLSEAGEKRINNAIIAAAYGDSEIVSLLTELGNEDIQTILNGLAMAAPDTAKLMGEAQQGTVHDVDYSKDLADAIRTIKNIRQNPNIRNLIKQFGSVGEVYLRQGTLGDDGLSPTARLFIGVLGNLNNKETISNFIKAVNNAVRNEGSPSQLGMFEENKKPSNEVFVERAIGNMGLKIDAERYEKGPSSVASNDDFHAEDALGRRYSESSEDYRTEAERLADDGTTATREEFDNLIQNVNDSIDPDAGISFEVYDSVEDFNKDRADNDKAPSDANAFIATKTDKKTGKKTSKIVLFRDKLTTLTRLKQVVAHELVGHEGIERLLGGRYYDIFLRSIRKLANRDGRVGKLLAQVQRTYGRFYAPESHQMYEELGAHLAELYARKPESFSDRVHSYIRKLKVMFRNALRNWGVDVEFNQIDLEDIFAKAREAVETTNVKESSTNDSGRRYSRSRKRTDDKNQLKFFDYDIEDNQDYREEEESSDEALGNEFADLYDRFKKESSEFDDYEDEDLPEDEESEYPDEYYGKERSEFIENYQKNGNVIFDILPRILEEDYQFVSDPFSDYEESNIPAPVQALLKITDNGEIFGDLDYFLNNAEGDFSSQSSEAIDLLEYLKEKVKDTFNKSFANKIVRNCDKAIEMIRKGEFKEGVIKPISIEELESQDIKKMPEDSWEARDRIKKEKDIYDDNTFWDYKNKTFYSLNSENKNVSKAHLYLNITNDSVEIPIENLRTLKNEPRASIERAKQYMQMAAKGEKAKRKPISVVDNGDGTYTVVDGNATTHGLVELGENEAICRVVGKNKGTRLENSIYVVENEKNDFDEDGKLRSRGIGNLKGIEAREKLYQQAKENLPQLEALVKNSAGKIKADFIMRPADEETGEAVKKRERVDEKAQDDYNGDYSRIVDLIGGTIVLKDDGDFSDAIKAIKKSLPDGAIIARVKKYNQDKGYRDIKINVRFSNGGLSEIIIVSDYINDAKFKRGGHDVYDVQRALEKYSNEENSIEKEAYEAVKNLTEVIYSRGEGAPDLRAFERIKSIASSALTRLQGQSSPAFESVKSWSSKFQAAYPPFSSSYAMPSRSFIKYAISKSPSTLSIINVDDTVNRFSSEYSENHKNNNLSKNKDLSRKYSLGKDGQRQTNLESDNLEDLYNNLMNGSEKVSQDNKDKRYSLAGKKARTANIDRLYEAQRMLTDGEDKKTVWQKTGWYIAKDGKPRFEIADKSFRIYKPTWKIIDSLGKGDAYSDVLRKLIKHDKLFKAYPFIGSMDLYFTNNKDDDYIAYYSGEGVGSIHVNIAKTGKDEIAIKTAIIHEIQHAIQDFEGFAKGSSVEYEMEKLKESSFNNSKIAEQNIRQTIENLNNPTAERIAWDYVNLFREFKKAELDFINQGTEETFDKLQKLGLSRKELRDQFVDLQKSNEPLKVIENNIVNDDEKEREEKLLRKAYENYHKSYGEGEARAVENRLDYADFDRDEFMPEDDFDYNIEESVISGVEDDEYGYPSERRRFSLSSQSGNNLSDEEYQKAVKEGRLEDAEKMADSRLNEKGYDIEAYHGTGRADRVGNEFRKKRATSGPMSMFTSDYNVAKGYSESKADTSLDYENNDYYHQYRVDADGGLRPIGDMWDLLPERIRRRIWAKAKHICLDDEAENIVFDQSKQNGLGNFRQAYSEHNGNVINALIDSWLESGDLFGEEERFSEVLKLAGITDAFKDRGWGEPRFINPDYREEKVYKTRQNIKNPFNTSTDFDNGFIDRLAKWWSSLDEDQKQSYDKRDRGNIYDLWNKNNWTFDEWVEKAEQDIKNGTTNVFTSIPDFVTDFLKSENFDGIVDQGGKHAGYGHTVYIPFESNQIKERGVTYDDNGNLIPLSQRGDSSKNDIRFSLSGTGKLNLNGEDYSVSSIEDYAKGWFMDAFEFDMDGESDTPIDIVNCKVVGSRAKGTNGADSDLDVVLEYDDPTDSWSEDSVYNILNEASHELNGVKVDINPIKKEDSGTLEDWLERNYDYNKNAEDSGKRYSLNRAPKSIEEYKQMEARPLPPAVKFDSIKELYDIYKDNYLGQTITTASGHTMTFNPGHFFRLICHNNGEQRKGFIEKANSSQEAIQMIEKGEIHPEDIAGFDEFRAKAMLRYKEVIEDPDFYYPEQKQSKDGIIRNCITFGRKYNGFSGDGFLAATLIIDNNKIGPLTFHPKKFRDKILKNKNLVWKTLENPTTNAPLNGETVGMQSVEPNNILQQIQQNRNPAEDTDSNGNPYGSAPEGRMYSISPVWTGSAADYDQPSTDYINTGEGAQVFGWGLYASSSEGVGRRYAEQDFERKTNIESNAWESMKVLFFGSNNIEDGLNRINEDIQKNGEKPFDDWTISALRNSLPLAKAELIDDYLRLGKIADSKSFLNQLTIELGEEYYGYSKSRDDEIVRLQKYIKNNYDRLFDFEFKPDTKKPNVSRNLYKQTAFPGKNENLLDWYLPVSKENKEKIHKAISELMSQKEAENPNEKFYYTKQMLGVMMEDDTWTGENVYNFVTRSMVSLSKLFSDKVAPAKAASEFLYSIGIDGIKYPVNSTRGNTSYDNGFNIVVFNNEDLHIDEHIRYSLSSGIDDRLNEMSDFVDEKLGRKLDKKDIDSLKAILETDKDSDLELNDIPTLKQRGVEFKDWLAKSLGQLIQGFVGDTQSKADRKKAPYLWQKDHNTEPRVETPFEISRRHNIEEGMKIREEEDRLVLKHLDADKNFFTGLIRKITKPGAFQDWMLKKASRILAPFQMMKPVENLLFTVAENIMWDEAKQQMVIAPYRDVELDGNNKPIGYKYDPNEKNGRLALDIYNNSLNDDFKAIIKERSRANNKFREDFVKRVVPYEQAKLYLAKFARKRLEGASKRIVDGNDQQAYSYITKLKGVIDDIDYKNLISQYDQIRNVPENQLGRNSAHINSIIGELTGNPGISSNGIDGKLRWLTTNKGLYGYAHHLVSIDPENGSGKPFNALSNLSHPWIETIAGDRRGRKSDSNENRSLLKADLERNRKEAEAEAANRWMEDTENQYGITIEEAKILEAKAQKDEGPGMPEGYEHRHKVVANFGKFRGKIIYLPDETFEAYQMVRDNRSLDTMKQFGEFMQGINNINGRINEAMLYHPGKAMRDLMAGPFHLLEFLRDWSMKHPTEIADACKAMLHGIKNSVSPEYWQSHTPESMGEYSESVFYQGADRQSPTVKLFDSVFKYFQKAIPVGQTLEAIRKEINLSGGADIPLKRIFTTIGEELADKRGLQEQERDRFIYDMVNDYAFDTGDLPEIIAWFRGKKTDKTSKALGMISRATVPFMGYATRMIKQMVTDPVTKGAIPLAKRGLDKLTSKRFFGDLDANSSLRSEISEVSRPFFWLLLKAFISAGLGVLLPEPTAEEIQDMPGLPPSARTHTRFHIGDSDKGERYMSVKGLGQLETAMMMDDFLKGKSNIVDLSSEFLTLHPIAKYVANLTGLYSEYDKKVPFTTQTGKLLANLIAPELTTRFTDDLAKIISAYSERGITDRSKQTFLQAFLEKLFGWPQGEVIFDREGHLRLSSKALETLKLFGVNVKEIPFDTIEETTRAEASRISNDAKKIQKLRDYRAGKYAPKTEREFLKQDFGGDFSSVEEAEKAYSNLAERERRLVDTATKLHKKGHWTDLEDIAREKKEAAAEKRKQQKEGKPSRRRPSRRKTSTRPLLNDDLGFINNEIRKNISREEEYQEFYDRLMQNNKKHNPRRGVAGQLERLLKELK